MSNNKKPTHRAFVVKNYMKDNAEKTRWLEIGTVWVHGDGKGFDVELEAVPTSGRIVLRLWEPKPATGDQLPA